MNVEDATWEQLALLKLKVKASSMDETINILLVERKAAQIQKVREK